MRRHVVLLLFMIATICLSSCGRKSLSPQPDTLDESSSGTKTVADPPLVGSSTTAGPLTPQDFADWTNPNIGQWGPVTASLVVPLPSGGSTVVNKLASPDPFTATYQLADGTIVTSNEPLTRLVDPNYVAPTPPVTIWVDQGVPHQIYDREILVNFERTVTAQQISTFLAQHGFTVIFSWFEPRPQPAVGNDMAWFQLSYNPVTYPTFSAARAFMQSQVGLVSSCRPNRLAEYDAHWGNPEGAWMVDPNDPLWQGDNAIYLNIHRLLENEHVRLGPEAGQYFSQQAVAVIDSGVRRNHEDFQFMKNGVLQNKISWCGVDTDHNNIWVGEGRGEPAQPYHDHGTRCAGIITAGTHNGGPDWEDGIGTASFAPMACILPIRPTYWVDEDGGHFGSDAIIKAYRALRFNFDKNQWTKRVRVVSMSIGGVDDMHPDEREDESWNINRDIELNDRLYVASAGNEMSILKRYPAAYAEVLGVSGLWFDCDYLNVNPPGPEPYPAAAWTPSGYINNNLSGSNSWPSNPSVYPVSGIYDTEDRPAGIGEHLVPSSYGSNVYLHMNGTSAAAPQIAALALSLFHERPSATHYEVESQIVNTRWTYMEASNPGFAGVADFHKALDTW